MVHRKTLRPANWGSFVRTSGKPTWSFGILFLILSAALVMSGIGWFRRRRWGWRLAVAIIAIEVLGDIINLFRGDWLRGGIGVVIAGALLLCLLTPRVRDEFSISRHGD